MNWYETACPICGGTLHDDPDDPGWLVCLLCSRSFAAARLSGVSHAVRCGDGPAQAGARMGPVAIGVPEASDETFPDPDLLLVPNQALADYEDVERAMKLGMAGLRGEEWFEPFLADAADVLLE